MKDAVLVSVLNRPHNEMCIIGVHKKVYLNISTRGIVRIIALLNGKLER